MDIAAMSIQMHADSLARDVGYAVMKKSMDSMETIAQNMLNMLPTPPSPYTFDVRA